MKKMLVVMLVIGCWIPVQTKAQSLDQLIEQLVLDYQKLSEFKSVLSDMYTGYLTIRKDFESVKSIAQGNFTLHQAFLDALWVVSPAVLDDPKVSRIIRNLEALALAEQTAGRYGGSSSTADVQRYTDEMTMVLSSGILQMSDAERLDALSRIDRKVSTRLDLVAGLNGLLQVKAGQQVLDQADNGSLRALYGLNP